MKGAQRSACITGLFVSGNIALRSLQRDGDCGLDWWWPRYKSSFFFRTLFCLLLQQVAAFARARTGCSLTSAGSRRSFVFGLNGCIIWDTSSGVKPPEEAWEASAWGLGGWVWGTFKNCTTHVLRLISYLISRTYFVLMHLFWFIFSFQNKVFTQADFHSFFLVCREGDFLFVSVLVCIAAIGGLACWED